MARYIPLVKCNAGAPDLGTVLVSTVSKKIYLEDQQLWTRHLFVTHFTGECTDVADQGRDGSPPQFLGAACVVREGAEAACENAAGL